MERILHGKNTFYICCILVQCTVTFATESNSNATSFKDVNGLMLLKMGRQLNKPLLTLIGMAVANLHPCAQWTTWSGCTAIRTGYLGIQKRTRKCGEKLPELLKVKTETDFTVCEGYCPDDYNVTTNGYCMKPYTTKKTQDDAEKQCNDESGHLINIDSDLKYADVKTIRKDLTSNIFIGGRRKDVNSPWIGSDGSPVTFIIWGDNDPDNGSDDLCLIINNGNLWFDTKCTNAFAFVCEISN